MVGDVIFVEGTGIVSKIIQKVTGGKWSHVAIFITDTLILEAEWNTKCRIIDIRETGYLSKNHEIIHIPLKPKQLELLNVAIYPFLGARYDYWLIIKLFFSYIIGYKLRKSLPKKVVCSELVAHILLILGEFSYDDFGISTYSPIELYNLLKNKY